MTIRKDLKWHGVKEFAGLNTRNAEDLAKDGELVDISNFSFDELGALKKINGNSLSSVISPGNFKQTTVEGTFTTAGTNEIIIPVNALDAYFEKIVLVAGGAGGGGGGGGMADFYRIGAPSFDGWAGGGGGGGGHGYHKVETNYAVLSGTTYEIVIGDGGDGGAGGARGYYTDENFVVGKYEIYKRVLTKDTTNGSDGTTGESSVLRVQDGATLLSASGGKSVNTSGKRGILENPGSGGVGGVGIVDGTAGSAASGTSGGAGGAGAPGNPSGEEPEGDTTYGNGGVGGKGGNGYPKEVGQDGTAGTAGNCGYGYYKLVYLTEV